MSLRTSAYTSPAWARNPHLQSLLASSPLRARKGRSRLQQTAAQHQPMLLEVGHGVRPVSYTHLDVYKRQGWTT